MCKIGIFGGTFNPIHLGHINIALSAKKQYSLDKVIFVTSGNPPHKRKQNILDGKIRHIMVKRAIEGIDGFCACDWEIKRKEYSYTLDSLLHFKEIYPGDDLYFIIGGDSLRDFDKWHKPEEIIKLCTLLVYNRAGVTVKSPFAKEILGDEFNISSSQIREMIENGKDVQNLLPKPVYEFIKRNHLYDPIGDIEAKLKTVLTPKRFAHSLGVRDSAIELAKIFGADVKKAEIAGLLHDNAKDLPDLLERSYDLEAETDAFERENIGLIHAKLGAETAKCEFGINDREITEAIKWHTIGKEDMSLLEKIVFVADLIEPGRNFPGVDDIRKYAKYDIDKAVLECVKATVRLNEKNEKPVHGTAYKIIGKNEKKI